VLPTSQTSPSNWRYTVQKPAANWAAPEFDATSWHEGPAGFGTEGTPGAVVHTRWSTSDIWLRRQITVPGGDYPNLQFFVHHDEDVEIYVNGILAATEAGFTTAYVPLEIRPLARAQLKPGAKITLAAHCHQTVGGQNFDLGLANVIQPATE